MSEFFTGWMACIIGLILLFCGGLLTAVVIQWRRGPTPEARAFAARSLRSTVVTAGIMMAGQNIAAMVNYPDDPIVPPGVHIALIVAGTAAFGIAVYYSTRDELRLRRLKRATGAASPDQPGG